MVRKYTPDLSQRGIFVEEAIVYLRYPFFVGMPLL
jgi:hypothetical protein